MQQPTQLALPAPTIRIRKTITKTALTAARTCQARAYRGLALSEWRPPSPKPNFAYYRAQHHLLSQIHRILVKGAEVEEAALPGLWADAWVRNGGVGPPAEEGLFWAAGYLRTNPFLVGRRIVAIEATLEVDYLGRRWSTRPDVLAVDRAGGVICIEASGAQHPIANRTEVQTQAALDLLALRYSAGLPAALREQSHRVVVGALHSGQEFDVTMEWDQVEVILNEIDVFLRHIEKGNRVPEPARETCMGCPFTDCSARWRLEAPIEESRDESLVGETLPIRARRHYQLPR